MPSDYKRIAEENIKKYGTDMVLILINTVLFFLIISTVIELILCMNSYKMLRMQTQNG